MSTPERACFILNPSSAGGRTLARLNSVKASAEQHFNQPVFWPTQAPGHATELARRAVDEGFGLVVAVGGDGTAHEVVNGLFDGRRPSSDAVVFGLLPAGTGCDLAKTLGMPKTIDEAMAVLAAGSTAHVDAVYATYQSQGAPRSEVCINVAGLGISGEAVARINRSTKRFGTQLTFFGAALASLVAYRPSRVSLRWTGADGQAGEWSGDLVNVFVANGAYCGAGMWVGRGGSMRDGLLDMTLIPALGVGRLLCAMPRLYSGTMGEVQGVQRHQVSWLRATCEDDEHILVDLDGEQPGVLPFELQVLPGVLRVRGRWA